MTAEECFGESRHKARKHHQCHSCGLGIWPGYFYIRGRYLFDRRAYSLAFHEQCINEVNRLGEAERQRNPHSPEVDEWRHEEFALALNAVSELGDREVSAEWLAWYDEEREFQNPAKPAQNRWKWPKTQPGNTES